MTKVLITIDTELSAGLFQSGLSADENFSRSIDCDGFGIGWQMDRLDAHRLTGVFFVDPRPALVYGIDVIKRIVTAILARGHEVQLDLHPEWLAWAAQQPVGARRGRSIGNFSAEDQDTLIRLARKLLVEAGAPPPAAFRARNFSANDDTLRVLAKLGVIWDTSFNPTYLGDPYNIDLQPTRCMAPRSITLRGYRVRPDVSHEGWRIDAPVSASARSRMAARRRDFHHLCNCAPRPARRSTGKIGSASRQHRLARSGNGRISA